MKNYTSTATDEFTVPGTWETYKPNSTWMTGSLKVLSGSSSPISFVGPDLNSERAQIINDMHKLENGEYPMGLDDIEELIEQIAIHGDVMGKLRFIIGRRP